MRPERIWSLAILLISRLLLSKEPAHGDIRCRLSCLRRRSIVWIIHLLHIISVEPIVFCLCLSFCDHLQSVLYFSVVRDGTYSILFSLCSLSICIYPAPSPVFISSPFLPSPYFQWRDTTRRQSHLYHTRYIFRLIVVITIANHAESNGKSTEHFAKYGALRAIGPHYYGCVTYRKAPKIILDTVAP